MGRPRKYPLPETQNKAQAKYGTDAGIEIDLYLPNREKHSFTVTIGQVEGQLVGSQKNPQVFEQIIRDMFMDRFGDKVK